MSPIFPGRYAAELDGDFVVFLIGMRVNRLLLVNKWLPVTLAMPRMLRELAQHPEMGLLHAQSFVSGRTVMVLQYWRSFEHLHAYAHARDLQHLPAWADFNRKVGGNGSVGIFHETYVVRAASTSVCTRTCRSSGWTWQDACSRRRGGCRVRGRGWGTRSKGQAEGRCNFPEASPPGAPRPESIISEDIQGCASFQRPCTPRGHRPRADRGRACRRSRKRRARA